MIQIKQKMTPRNLRALFSLLYPSILFFMGFLLTLLTVLCFTRDSIFFPYLFVPVLILVMAPFVKNLARNLLLPILLIKISNLIIFLHHISSFIPRKARKPGNTKNLLPVVSKGVSKYEGDLVEGLYEGYGTETWYGIGEYKGMFMSGMWHGYGVFMPCQGVSYAREWRFGQKSGIGEYLGSNGNWYEGQYRNNAKHGIGCNGDQFFGQHSKGKMHGFGLYKYSNGYFYEGHFCEDKMHGYGILTCKDGGLKSGSWEFGFLKKLIPPPFPLIAQSVQAAENVAQKLVFLPGVEEQVIEEVTKAGEAAS